jgi:hypothetical protein
MEAIPDNDSLFQNIEVNELKKRKCNLCNAIWSRSTMGASAMTGHLSNAAGASKFGVKLCPSVPANVSNRNVIHISKQ